MFNVNEHGYFYFSVTLAQNEHELLVAFIVVH